MPRDAPPAADIHEAAAATALAGLQGLERMPSFPGRWQPADVNAAYRVQRQARELCGLRVAGYKVGMTNPAVRQAEGLAEPIVGWLAPAWVRDSGSVIRAASRRMRAVESEIIFLMQSDLAPGGAPHSLDEVTRAVAAAYAGLELCDSRFLDPDSQPALNVIADNSNASLIVIGSRFPALPRNPLEVTLSCGPSPPVAGSTAAVFGDPLLSLCWLANWLHGRGEGLAAGQYVATGSCTGITIAGPSDHCVAQFGADATVECYFVP